MRLDPAAVFRAAPRPARGVAMMLIASVSVVSMNVLIRLVSDEIHILEIAFFRTVFGFLVLVPWLVGPGLRTFRTEKLGMHAVRAVLNVTAMYLYFFGLLAIPLAKVNALAFTSPLFASVLAVLVLRERITRARVLGLAMGFAGALVILRPGVVEVDSGGLLILCSCAVWACALVVIKVLARTESSLTIAVYAALLQIPFSAVFALFVWQWPNPYQLGIMAGVGALGGLAHLTLAQAFRETDATVVLPADFTKLVWASLAGFLVFAEIPDPWTLLGALIICGAVFYLATRGGRPARA